MNEIRQTILKTLQKELVAIEKIKEQIDESFSLAVNMFISCTGSIIVSGVGKSGTIGELFSSKLASISIPSYFISPLDFNHGCLGGIRDSDIIVLISNSGNTEELFPILSFVESNRIPIIAITGNKDSILAKKASCALIVESKFEASELCPMIPICSTIVAHAVCDSIICTLIEQKGFTSAQFINSHPGGAIGKMHGFKEEP